MAKITMKRTIEIARGYLGAGNGGAYARLLSGAIRAAMDDRVDHAIRAAIAEDKAEALFVDLDTSCPLAA
jgi:hypothetical protein